VIQGQSDEVRERLIDDDQHPRGAEKLMLLYLASLRGG
jgi:hypothetical protein